MPPLTGPQNVFLRHRFLTDLSKVKDLFNGVLPSEKALTDGILLSGDSTKNVRVVPLQLVNSTGEIEEAKNWVIKGFGPPSKTTIRAGLAELVGRTLYGTIITSTPETPPNVSVPEAFVYQTNDNVFAVTKFEEGLKIEDDISLLTRLSLQDKATIALCILLTDTREFPPSSILYKDTSGKVSLIDLESAAGLFDNLENYHPDLALSTKLTLSMLQTYLPFGVDKVDELRKYAQLLSSSGNNWEHTLGDRNFENNLTQRLEIETGFPRNGSPFSGENILTNLRAIANYYKINGYVERTFDKTIALRDCRGDESLFRELINIFLANYEQQLTKLETAIRDSNGREIQRIAHTIKGTAVIFAANKVSYAAQNLEVMGKTGNLNDAPQAFEELKEEVLHLVADLS